MLGLFPFIKQSYNNISAGAKEIITKEYSNCYTLLLNLSDMQPVFTL
jgi:hypothetical protein